MGLRHGDVATAVELCSDGRIDRGRERKKSSSGRCEDFGRVLMALMCLTCTRDFNRFCVC